MSEPVTKLRGAYYALSNFSRAWFIFPDEDGIERKFSSVEQAFVYFKTIEKEKRTKILYTHDPRDIKRIGKTARLRYGWSEMRLDLMYKLLTAKFEQSPGRRAVLMATGDRDIIQGNWWHDQFWGSCICPEHADIPGQNHLGKTLVRVRGEIRVREKR